MLSHPSLLTICHISIPVEMDALNTYEVNYVLEASPGRAEATHSKAGTVSTGHAMYEDAMFTSTCGMTGDRGEGNTHLSSLPA